jgi:hypothetical protein
LVGKPADAAYFNQVNVVRSAHNNGLLGLMPFFEEFNDDFERMMPFLEEFKDRFLDSHALVLRRCTHVVGFTYHQTFVHS